MNYKGDFLRLDAINYFKVSLIDKMLHNKIIMRHANQPNMKKYLILFIGVITALNITAQNQSDEILNNVFRIKFQENIALNFNENTVSSTNGYLILNNDPIDELNNKYRVSVMKRVFPYAGKFEEKHKRYGLHLWYDIFVDENTEINGIVEKYGALDIVSRAETVKLYSQENISVNAVNATNDPRFEEQWHYNNIGQTSGRVGSDISLLEAWEQEAGDARVVVSVHDSGIDYTHPDLKNRLWINDGEIANDGIDNDNNGFVDDYYGFNFAAQVVGGDPSDVYDFGGHGTHTSGTIAAENNNGIGVSGVAGGSNRSDGVRIMMMRLGDDRGSNSIYNPAPSFIYAADMGAVISSNSWGGGGYDQSLVDAINYFVKEAGSARGALNGGLVVMSSGNSSSSFIDYRSNIEGVMMVSATNHNDQRAWYSNYGTWVDISAPGGETSTNSQGVLSTLPNNRYGFYQGTSMACPHVTGVAALLASKSYATGLTNKELFEAIKNSADPIDDLNQNYSGLLGSGRINAAAALDLVGSGGGNYSGELLIDPIYIHEEILATKSKTFTVRVVNSHEYDLDIDIILEEQDWLISEAANLSIAANSVSKFQIELKAQEIGSQLNSEINLSYISFNDKVSQSIPVSMYTLGEPTISTPDTLFFPINYQGTTESKNLVVSNIGTNYLKLLKATQANEDFALEFDTVTIAPNAKSIYSLKFTPSKSGIILDSLFFTTNDPKNEVHKMILKGIGNANKPPLAMINPEEISFEVNQPEYGTRAFYVKNIGGEELSFSLVANPRNDLQIIGNTSLVNIDPLDSIYNNQKQTELVQDNETNNLGSLLNQISSPVDQEMGMAWDGTYLWIRDANSKNIYRFDINNKVVVDSIQSIAEHGVKLDFDGTYLWEHDFRKQLIKYNLDGDVISKIELDENRQYFEGIAYDGNGIWMAYSNYFVLLDEKDGSDLDSFQNYYSRNAEGIINVGNLLFVVGNGRIYEIAKGDNGYNRSSYIAGHYNLETEDIAYDGLSAWVNSYNHKSLVKIDLFNDFISYINPRSSVLQPGDSVKINANYNLRYYFLGGITYYDEVLIQSNSVGYEKIILPIKAHLKGAPQIKAKPNRIAIQANVDVLATDTVLISNSGNEKLSISSIISSNSNFSFDFTATELLPNKSMKLPISVTQANIDTLSATLTIMSNDPINGSLSLPMEAYINLPAEISIEQDSLEMTLFESQIDSVLIKISNTGSGELFYYIDNNPIVKVQNNRVISSSINYVNNDSITNSETAEQSHQELYSSEAIKFDGINSSKFILIEDVLESLNNNESMIASLIPSKYNFSEGETGYRIIDGGKNMYDGGNRFYTNLGSVINYTNSTIKNSSYFGSEKYFTAKYDGLFVLTSNLNNVDRFGINGNIGNNGNGSVNGVVLSLNNGRKEFLGFVKRVYGSSGPSVNHLIIVENNGNLSRNFSPFKSSDYHEIHGLSESKRLYYLLFASENGGLVNNDSMLDIMEEFLSVIGEINPLNSIKSNSSSDEYIVFDAENVVVGKYKYEVKIHNNDLSKPIVSIPTNLTIKSAPVIESEIDTLKFENIYVGSNPTYGFRIKNTGSDTLFISDYAIEGSELFSIEGQASIPPGIEAPMIISFSPLSITDTNAKVIVQSNDPVKPRFTLPLFGNGVASSILELSENYVQDTISIDSTYSYPFIVTNKGTLPLNFEMIIKEAPTRNSLIEWVEVIRQKSGIYQKNLLYEGASSITNSNVSLSISDEKQLVGYRKSEGVNGNILILAADDFNSIDDVVTNLISTNEFSSVSFLNTTYYTDLSLLQLERFDAILIWSRYSYRDANKIGDLLAEYSDSGRGVVTAVFENTNHQLRGKWSDEYEKHSLYDNRITGTNNYGYTYLNKIQVNHELLFNVDTLNGGRYSYRTRATLEDVAKDVEVVATWNDNSPLILAKDNRVDLGFYPVSSNSNYRNWSSQTDGVQIMVNALNYVSKHFKGRSELDWISSSTYQEDSIAAGTSFNGIFEVDTKDLKEGRYRSRAVFYSNDSRHISSSQYLDLVVDGKSKLSVTDTLYMEDVTLGFSGISSLPIFNSGNGHTKFIVEIDSLSEFKVNTDTLRVAAFGGYNLQIALEPDTVGLKYQKMAIHDLIDGQMLNVILAANINEPGKIRIEPNQLDLDVQYQNEVDSSFIIFNDGKGKLNFQIESFHIQDKLQNLNVEAEHKKIEFDTSPIKGAVDTRIGYPNTLGIGQDSFGYTYIDNKENNGPEYIWDDISSTGKFLELGDDDYSQLELPFEFPFYGKRHTKLNVSSNGLIGFNEQGMSNPINQQIPTNSSPNGFISAFWKDLTPNNGGKIYYLIDESKLTIQYQEVVDFEKSGSFTFQIVLYRTGDIIMYFENMDGTTSDATIGLEDYFGGNGLPIAFNTDYITNKLAVSIAHPLFKFNPRISSGTIAPGDSLAIPFKYSSLDDLGGIHNREISIIANDTSSVLSTVNIDATVHGISYLSAFSDTLTFDTTYTNIVSSRYAWVRNDSVGVARIENIASSNSNFKMVHSLYDVKKLDDEKNVVYELSLNTRTGRIYGKINIEKDRLISIKAYQKKGDQKRLIWDINTTNTGSFEVFDILELSNDKLWLLANGEIFLDVFTSNHVRGIGEENFKKQDIVIYPYQYSSRLNVLYKPTLSETQTTQFTLSSNAVNNESFKIVATGVGKTSTVSIEIDKSEINEVLTTPDSTTQTFKVSNTGIDTLSFSMRITDKRFESNLYPIGINNSSRLNEISSSSDKVKSPNKYLIPKRETSEIKKTEIISLATDDLLNDEGRFYGRAFSNRIIFGHSSVLDPSNFKTIQNAQISSNLVMASEFLIGSKNKIIELDVSGALFIRDLERNELTYVRQFSIGECIGMTTNPISGQVYIATNSRLYKLNMDSFQVTLVGNFAHGDMIGISMDKDQKMFGYTLDDEFVKINALTGLTTYVGHIGFDARFGQDMGYNEATDELFMAAFNANSFKPELRLVNKQTGQTTYLGAIGSNINLSHMTSIAFPLLGSSYISTNIRGGLVPPGDSIEITTTIHSNGLNSGNHTANISIASNDLSNPLIDLPIGLMVNGNFAEIGDYSESINFGLLVVKDTSKRVSIVENIGKDVLEMVLQNISENFKMNFVIGDTLRLDIGESKYIPIDFVPTAAQTYEFDMVWKTNDPSLPEIIISMAGAGERASQELFLGFESFALELPRNSDSTFVLNMSSMGKDTVKYTIQKLDNETWIDCSKDSLFIAPNNSIEYPIMVNTDNILIGEYFGKLLIKSNDPLYDSLLIPIELKVINNAPQMIGELQGGLLAIGEEEDSIKYLLSDYFHDLDKDTINYNITSKTGNADFNLELDTVKIFGVNYGNDTLSIFAFDAFGDTIRRDIVLFSNNRPGIIDPLPNYYSRIENGYKELINLNDYFSDADNNSISFEISELSTLKSELLVNAKNTLMLKTGGVVGVENVTITSFDGFHKKDQSFELTIDAILGIKEELEESFILYPNPVGNSLEMGFDLRQKADVKIQLLNVMGQVIVTEELRTYSGQVKHRIDVSNLIKGIYLVKIIVNDEPRLTQRVSKQ